MTAAVKSKVSLIEITPQLAEEWLKKRPHYQRKIDQKQVKKLALAIQRGEWRENGATLVFNEAGDLIDGQHRLEAVLMANKPISSLVVQDVSKDESTFDTIGDEKARKVADFLQCARTANVAAVVKMHWQIVNGIWPIGHGGPVAPIAEVVKLARKWQNEIVPLVEPLCIPGRLVGQHSFLIFLTLYFTKLRPGVVNPERLAQFMSRLGDGLELTATDPVYKLRQRFLTVPTTGRIQRTVAQALIMKALYLYLDGQPCKNLKFEPDREEFPELRGLRK